MFKKKKTSLNETENKKTITLKNATKFYRNSKVKFKKKIKGQKISNP